MESNKENANVQSAWQLWHQLERFSQALWEQYEPQFIEICTREAQEYGYDPPAPWDDTPV